MPAVTAHDRYFMPLFGAAVGCAWLALLLWDASPYSRYLAHDWTSLGLAGSLCAGLPAGEAQARRFVHTYVRPYFQEVSKAMQSSGYKIGAYGSGLVCSYLLDEKFVDYCWLANATAWPGYQSFEASKRWILKQHLTTRRAD